MAPGAPADVAVRRQVKEFGRQWVSAQEQREAGRGKTRGRGM